METSSPFTLCRLSSLIINRRMLVKRIVFTFVHVYSLENIKYGFVSASNDRLFGCLITCRDIFTMLFCSLTPTTMLDTTELIG